MNGKRAIAYNFLVPNIEKNKNNLASFVRSPTQEGHLVSWKKFK